MNRRDLFKGTLAGAAALAVGGSEPVVGATERVATEGAKAATPASAAEIYKLLGFAPMTGEDPLKMWSRLRETQHWLPDDSYARLVWRMPDGGPEITYEWARTDRAEVLCRITHSSPATFVAGLRFLDSNPPALAVVYSQSTDRTFVRGRSRMPGTRDGMRWVLSLSAAVEEGTGIGTGSYHGILRDVRTLYLCGRQGQTYETLEKGTRE